MYCSPKMIGDFPNTVFADIPSGTCTNFTVHVPYNQNSNVCMRRTTTMREYMYVYLINLSLYKFEYPGYTGWLLQKYIEVFERDRLAVRIIIRYALAFTEH